MEIDSPQNVQALAGFLKRVFEGDKPKPIVLTAETAVASAAAPTETPTETEPLENESNRQRAN
jgi:hypothetical protein